MNLLSRCIIVITGSFLTASCAVIHKTQLADIDSHAVGHGKKISLKMSETTVNLNEAGQVASALGDATKRRGFNAVDDALSTYTALFQFGPKTGTPVFTESFGAEVTERLRTLCKNGRLTNIVSVREAKEYPVIKGEIIRIDAICIAQASGKKDKKKRRH